MTADLQHFCSKVNAGKTTKVRSHGYKMQGENTSYTNHKERGNFHQGFEKFVMLALNQKSLCCIHFYLLTLSSNPASSREHKLS